MNIVEIFTNEIQSYNVENYSFETILKFFGTESQITNIKNNVNLSVGNSVQVDIKNSQTNAVIDSVSGVIYMSSSGCQIAYGVAQLNYQIALRKI